MYLIDSNVLQNVNLNHFQKRQCQIMYLETLQTIFKTKLILVYLYKNIIVELLLKKQY